MRKTEPLRALRLALAESLETRQLLSAATVNFNAVYQSIDGFGTETVYGNNPIPPASALHLAYSQTSGIGLDFVRGSVNANGSNRQVAWEQEAAAYGVQFVESPRGPAVSWLADFGDATNGYLDPSHYQDYANLLADFVQNSAAQGIPIYSISMAVEPDLVTSITNSWTAQEFAALLPYVGQTFEARGITTKIMVNEDVGQTQADRSQIMADPNLSQYVSILADHAYGQTYSPYISFTNAQGRHIWMTENIPQTSGNTDIQNALQLATDVHNAMTISNASAYFTYWMSYLMSSMTSTTWTPNASFWAMGNYSKFVRPGWVRVGETDDGGLTLTTFDDPVSGKFAIVAANSGSSAITESYTLNGLSATSVTPYLTSSTSDLAQQSSIAISNNVFSATIGAQSIVTYYGQASGAATLQTPVRLTAATEYGHQTSQIALSWTDNSSTETGLTLQRSTSATNWSGATTINLAAGTELYVDTGLNEASTYYYRIEANNGTTSTGWSSIATGSTILAAPSGLTATPTSGGNTLSWTRSSGVNTGASIQRSTDGLTWTTIYNVSGTGTTYTDTISGYNSNQIYWYRVRNTDGAQSSAYAQVNTTVNTPGNFKLTTLSATSVELTWTNSSVGAYAAYISEDNNEGNQLSPANLSANADSFIVTGLTENTAYTFDLNILGPDAWYRPSVGVQYGAWSSTVSVSTTTPVAAPTNLTAISSTAGTAVLKWTDNSSVETGYDVQRSSDGSTWTDLTTILLAANTTTYTDSTAPTSGTVYYRVKAVDSSVSSAFLRTQMAAAAPVISTAGTVTGTTTTLTAAAPSGFGSGSLTYTWSLDGTPPGAVAFSANGTTAAASTTATFAAAGSYTFRITITDAAGDSTSAATAVTVSQTVTSLTVQDKSAQASYGGPAAPTPSINASTWEQLAAEAYDQFGNAMSSQPSFTWSVVSGGGSITSGGLYSAPATAATPIVQALSGSVQGQIQLNVITNPTPVADLAFNETSGFTLSDTGSSGVVAEMSGGTSLVMGRVGNAVLFDGQSGSVWLGVPGSQEPTDLDIRGQITMAAWIEPTSTSGTQTIISRGYGSYPNWGGTFLRISGGQYQVGYYDSGGFHCASYTMPASDVGKWVYIVGTYDGKEWNLYRNGTLAATFSSTLGAIYSDNDWRIGSSDIPADYFQGEIDDPRLYGQALSASAIGALYNQTITVTSAAAASPSPTTSDSTALSVAAVDPDTNSDADLIYTWSMVSGPATASFSLNGTNAAKDTTVTCATPGTYQFTVTIRDNGSAGLSTTSSVSVLVQGSPAQAATAVANPAPVTGTSTQLSVQGVVNGGVGNATYQWSSSGPAGVSFSNNNDTAAQTTYATFTQAGNYIFTVQIDGAGGSVTSSSVNVTVASTLTSIAVTPYNPIVSQGATQQLSAVGYDQFGNTMAPNLSWSVPSGIGSVSSSGLYTAPSGQGGAIVVQASSGAVSGDAVVSVPMDNSDASRVAITGAWSTGTYTSGFIGTNYYYTSTLGSSMTYTPVIGVAGEYEVYARWTSAYNRATNAPITVNSAAGANTVSVNQQASGGTWYDLGSYSFAAGTTGNVVVSDAGANGQVIADGMLFQLDDAAPTVATPASANVAAVSGTSVALSVLGSDPAGESGLSYTWAATAVPAGASAPTLSINGSNAAKNTVATFTAAGSYDFTVTIADAAGLSTTSTVDVSVSQTVTTITLTPTTVTRDSNATQQYTATGYDQFGTLLTTQPAFTYSIAAGGLGSINSSGLYTAPASGGGSATVVAATSDASQMASVTIVAVTSVNLVNNGSSTSNATQTLSLTATVSGGVPDGSTVTLEDANNNDAVVATATTTNGVANLSVAAGTLLAGTHQLFAVYGGSATSLASQSATLTQTVQVVVIGAKVNGNIASLVGAQRSVVDSVVYSFSEAVYLGAGAFTIAVHSGQSGTAPTLSWAAINPNGDGSATQWVVTFSGAGVTGDSIANGVYDITLAANAASSDANPAVTAATRTDTFYRLYGDYLGTQKVTLNDYNAFLATYNLKSNQAGYNEAFDLTGTGAKISLTDYDEFLADYNIKVSGFTATI